MATESGRTTRGGGAAEDTHLAIAGLVKVPYDYFAVTYPDAVTETYTYKKGGATGTTVSVVTLVYTDSTKSLLLTGTRVS
jgi:hypothetical protein